MSAITAQRCSNCGKETQYDADRPRFCAHCAHPFDAQTSYDERVRAVLTRARAEEDMARRHSILTAGKAELGEAFEIERELLFMGRLYERGGKPDFYRIPYWPLNALERPDEFSAKQRKRMLDAFFDDPEYARVSALAPDPNDFKDEYFNYMARQYVKLFIKGNLTNFQFLGFRRRAGDAAGRCAGCMARMLIRLSKTDEVRQDDKFALGRALARAFEAEFEADDGARRLRERLGDNPPFDLNGENPAN